MANDERKLLRQKKQPERWSSLRQKPRVVVVAVRVILNDLRKNNTTKEKQTSVQAADTYSARRHSVRLPSNLRLRAVQLLLCRHGVRASKPRGDGKYEIKHGVHIIDTGSGVPCRRDMLGTVRPPSW